MYSSLSNNTNKQNNLYWAVLLCILPILDPYILAGGIMIVEFISLALVLCAIISTKIMVSKNLVLLLFFFFSLAAISAMLSDIKNLNFWLQVKVLFYQIISIVAFGFLWRKSGKEAFLKIVVIVGVIAASLAIIQFVAVTLGFTNFYDGRLPFAVSTNNHFGGLFDRNTGDLRVHSFFEEPSYLALFELPVFAYCIKNRKIKSSVVVGISCVLTGSMLGVLGVAIVMLYILLIDPSIRINIKLLIVLFLAIAGLACAYLYRSNSSVQELFDYLFNRVTTINSEMERSDSSVSLRLFGNIKYFEEYPFINKLLGTGFNQYAVYFNLGKNYSNDFVTTLLDFGILGLIALGVTLISMFKKTQKEGRIYFLIFVIALGIDHIWFNIYFFYLLTWCAVFMQNSSFVTIRFK